MFPALSPERLGDILPWKWWSNLTGQVGFININEMASAKPGLEADIIENVASYGRQLGRITDVVEALLKRSRDDWDDADRKAEKAFREMAEQIEIVKAGHIAPSRDNVERMIAGIESLEKVNRKEHAWVVDQIRKKLFADARMAPKGRAKRAVKRRTR
jgi:hypothetical protein